MLLWTDPWRRAPALLRRTPAVFAACLLASVVLAVAASSGVLFLSAAGAGALHSEAAQECPQDGEPAITNDQGPARDPSAAQTPAGLRRGDPAVRRALGSAGLPAPQLVATAYAGVAGNPADAVSLFARPGAAAHVQLVQGSASAGLLIPQSLARTHQLRVGSSLRLGAGVAVVAGIYRDLAPSAFVPMFRLPRYWCAWTRDIVPTPQNRPPPMVLTDLPTLESLAGTVTATWYVPRSAADETVARSRAALAAATAALGVLESGSPPRTYQLRSDLPYLLSLADRERAGLGGAVLPIDIAGTLVAAMLVAGAGAYWGVRRRAELRLLGSRGVGPLALGAKGVLETAPAIALGTALGWLLAIALVRALGPSPMLEPGAPWQALLLAIAAAVAGLLALGLLAANAAPSDRVPRRRRLLLRRTPWELALAALSVATYLDVRHDGAVRVVKGTVQIDPFLLAFPLLALTAAVLVVVRGGSAGLQRVGVRAQRLPGPAYLAVRRLAGTPLVAVGALIGVAIPIGVLIYSAALSGSTSSQVLRKYETNVGAQHAFGTLAVPGSTPRLDGAGTVVSMIQAGPQIDGGVEVQVLGLDPATFPRYAYGGAQLAGPLSELRGGRTAVRALLVNAPPGTRVRSLAVGSMRIPIRVVGRRASFPGERNPFEPLLVVDRAALAHLPPSADRTEEVWTSTASAADALAALRRDRVDAAYEISPQTFLTSTRLRPLTWIFGYLRALAYLTGAVALTALTFAFTARTRRLALSYHLARRMGLSRAAHRRSLSVELAVLLVASWATGVGLAFGAVALVYRLADVYPDSPPPPVFPVPSVPMLSSVAVAVAVGALGSFALQRMLDRIAPADLLRAP